MTQYVIQIQIAENDHETGWLAKCFEVTEKCPIPAVVPDNREQIIMTNTVNFDEIVAAYEQYTTQLVFRKTDETVSCVGAMSKTWSIN